MVTIKSLTPEQEALIPIYCSKWRSLITSTERLNRSRVEGSLRAAYLLAEKPEPEFRFLNGPNELKQLREQQSALAFIRQFGAPVSLLDTQVVKRIRSRLDDALKQHIETQLLDNLQLQSSIYSLATHPFADLAAQAVREGFETAGARGRDDLRNQLGGEFLLTMSDTVQQMTEAVFQTVNATIQQVSASQPFMQPITQWQERLQVTGQALSTAATLAGVFNMVAAMQYSYLDFYSSILDFSDSDQKHLATIRSIFRACSALVIPFETLCLVIERPTKISLDAEGKLHADHEPALVFADGAEFYIHHGECITPD
ncbi:MAG: DUF6745 domain-containing protein [Cyanobacteria bacterium P01_A01_bin.123]